MIAFRTSYLDFRLDHKTSVSSVTDVIRPLDFFSVLIVASTDYVTSCKEYVIVINCILTACLFLQPCACRDVIIRGNFRWIFQPTGQWLSTILNLFGVHRKMRNGDKVTRWHTKASLKNKNANPVSYIIYKCFIQVFTRSSFRQYLGQLLHYQLFFLQTCHPLTHH